MFLKDDTAVDMMYRSLQWAEEQVEWVYGRATMLL
jgi:hypothetical protein